MDGTPRLKSAFPATPQIRRRPFGESQASKHTSQRLSQLTPLSSNPAQASSTDPVVPEHIIDAPSQRLYAVTIWAALWAWKVYDYISLQELEEQSLWLFMKWVAFDGVFLFGLPGMRIPWLEWTAPTMMMLFLGHAFADFMMMFRVALPIGAAFTAIARGMWGAYEMAVNEHSINPESVKFNESLILGRQVIHILPEGSAVLNMEKAPFCLDDASRNVVNLPITINATNPISMELIRIDLDTQANETIHIGKKDIKNMHRDAARLLTYSDKPNEPKTIYWPVKKSGIYMLQKVMDETNLEVKRKNLAHTTIVPCPKAAVLPSESDKCKGDLSGVDIEVVGTPPLRLKYRKMINHATQDATFESIQPEDFVSPLSKTAQNALSVPNYVETYWAKPQKVRVPLSEGLSIGGSWVYSIEEVTDAFGNVVSYSEKDHDRAERHRTKSSNLHQIITVNERPTVMLAGCSAQNPLKVPKDISTLLPVHFGSSGRGNIEGTAFHLEYKFSPQQDLSTSGDHGAIAQIKKVSVKDYQHQPSIQAPGLYTIMGISTDYCTGDVLEPASCLLQNPTEPSLSIKTEEIADKCAGSPIGLRVDLDLTGTPPFDIEYTMQKAGDRHHSTERQRINGLRGQIELTPKQAGDYVYRFIGITDSVYKVSRPVNEKLEQKVKPAASARFNNAFSKTFICIDNKASFDVSLHGEGPFNLEYELIHGSKRKKTIKKEISDGVLTIETDNLNDGGDYTLALVSVTDRMGCKEFLKDEAKIGVRHQKPKVGFGLVDGRRSINTLEGSEVQLPLRLAGEAPWTVKYRDNEGREQKTRIAHQNDRLSVVENGKYQLLDVHDSFCPGQVDEAASEFDVGWIARPEFRVAADQLIDQKGNSVVKADVCEGDEDAIEVMFKGSAPYHLQYVQHVKPLHGAVAPKTRDIRAPANIASIRMDTAQAGLHEYKINKLEDSNYEHNSKQFKPISIQQRVNARPTVAFTTPGKTYSYCSIEADGEEVIPITLQGQPPFDVEVEIKHHGSVKPEIYSLHGIKGHSHNIRIPHSRITPGKSAVQLRRVSDSNGCGRLLDSTAPRVQISVHDLPTITPLESHEDFCVGDRINFALSGTAPFTVTYKFEGYTNKAIVSGTTFRRLAEKPGTFTIIGLQDSASNCRAATNITKHIHGLPSVRVSHGRDTYVDIHEGGEAEILFDFGGVPPFEFTYTRSSNTEKGGKKPGVVLDMRSEVSDEHSMRISANEEGTYEVVAIKDRYCAYAKPGIKSTSNKKLLMPR